MQEHAVTVKRLGREAEFDLVRVAPATDLHIERARYLEWIEAGRHGGMRWIDADRAVRASSPGRIVPGAASVISVGMSYWAGHRREESAGSGRIARYAWGADYHRVLGDRLRDLCSSLAREFGGEHRWFVDTGPVMDKAVAARSGLGWYGKNTNILTERFGSYVLLGEIITSLVIEPDAPLDKDCGSCRLCLVACPTGALGPEYSIDSRKCISYLTIEHREAIPPELREGIGDWVFGCDICQDVCPPTMIPHLQGEDDRRAWATEVRRYTTRRTQSAVPASPIAESPIVPVEGRSLPHNAVIREVDTRTPTEDGPPTHPLFPHGTRQSIDLLWLLRLTHDEYVKVFRGSSIRRAKVWMLRRNAAVALGNVGDESCVPALVHALLCDDCALVRGHAAWAIGRLASRFPGLSVRDALSDSLALENDRQALQEIQAALDGVPVA